jgi:NADPH:quinone reductase-like Zn-dependent oxidoreductase
MSTRTHDVPGTDATGPVSETTRMRAVVTPRYGGADVVQEAVIGRPDIADDEVLVEVRAAGVDRGTWHLMTGTPYLIRVLGFGLTRPKQPVPGLDVAGVVVAVGKDVERFTEGDEVFGIGRATFAEYAAAPERKLSHKPATVSFEAAGVAAISGSTALQALTDVGRVEAGQSVLVIGASGGVGSYAVQIATALGAHVTGVSSAAKAESVMRLGAERTIDYAAGDYLDGSTRYDLIIDAGGLNPVRRLKRALTPTGTLVIVGGEGGGNWTGGIGRNLRAAVLSVFSSQRLTAFINREHHESTDRLADLMSSGAVVPFVGGEYPLARVRDALADLEAGRVTGKSVIVVRPTGA